MNDDLLRALEAHNEAVKKMPAVGEPWVDGEPPRQRLLCRWGFHPSTFVQGIGFNVWFEVCNECYRRVS